VKGLREADLRHVKDVAGSRARKIAQNVRNVGDRRVRSRGDYDCNGFDRLRAAATRHAGWRARAVILTRLRVTRAGLRNDQSVGAGGAERQQGDDDCKSEPPHQASVALVRPTASDTVLTPLSPYFYVATLDSARTR